MAKKYVYILLAGCLIIGIVFILLTRVSLQTPTADVPVATETSDQLIETSDQPSLAEQLSFEVVLNNYQLSNAPLWVFAVPEDDGRVVVSTERDGGIFVGVLDLDDPTASIDWQQVISSQDIEGKRVADHWHIFAHNAHWIVFSVNANQGYLLKLDKNFQRLGLTSIEHEDPTNDMFLVESPEGVAAGFFLVGYGNRIYKFDQDLNLLGTKDIGGGEIRHSNGSSALMVDNQYFVFATDSLNPLQQGKIRLLKFDSDWNFISSQTLIDEEETNAAMGSAVVLDDGSIILVARLIPDVYPRGVRAPMAIIGETPDFGQLIRFVFDPDGELLSRETIVEDTIGNRPHVSLVDDLLLTGWDASGGYLRIDRIQK